MFIRILCIAIITLWLQGSVVCLASPLSNVGGATVQDGLHTMEWRGAYELDESGKRNHQRFRMRQHYDIGFTDWYAGRVSVVQNKLDEETLQHQNITIENRFQLIEERDYGWNGGIRLNYTHARNNVPDHADVRLIANVPFNHQWEWRYDTVLRHEIGERRQNGIQAAIRNRVTRAFDLHSHYIDSVITGVELFNNLGFIRQKGNNRDQTHIAGVMGRIHMKDSFYIQSHYRKGLSNASVDHGMGLIIGKRF